MVVAVRGSANGLGQVPEGRALVGPVVVPLVGAMNARHEVAETNDPLVVEVVTSVAEIAVVMIAARLHVMRARRDASNVTSARASRRPNGLLRTSAKKTTDHVRTATIATSTA